MKVGDRVIINPNGHYPEQGGGGEGVVTSANSSAGLPIRVEWDNASSNGYKESDLILVHEGESIAEIFN